MIWTLFSLISLVVLGGFISYYGDLQGRRWGKKRVSWFGMRPKHTAILITSLTGAFISLLSVATLLIVSPTVRDVIYRGEQALRENKRLTAQYRQDGAQYRQDMLDSKLKIDQAQQDLRHTQQRRMELEQQKGKLQADVTALQTRVNAAAATVAQLEKRQSELVARLRDVQSTLHSTVADNQRAGRVNLSLGKQTIKLSLANSQLDARNRNLTTQNVRIAAENELLTDKQVELTRDNAKLDETNKSLLEANRSDLQKSQADLQTKQEELKHVNGQLGKARQELAQAMEDLAGSGQYFAVNYNKIKQGRISVRADGELARCVIDAHMPQDIVAQKLNELLDNASKTALKCGAAAGPNGRAVRIMSKHLVTLTDEQYIYEKESLKTLAENLTGFDKPVVVVVSAFSNAVEGEQVPVELRPTAVVSMFPAGAVLASCRINAGLTDEQLKQAIAQFLQTDVRNAMVKAGAISQVDPLSGLSQLGQYDAIDLGLLAVRVRQLRGDVVIKAVAASAITSSDPLDRSHLRLDVARAVSKDI